MLAGRRLVRSADYIDVIRRARARLNSTQRRKWRLPELVQEGRNDRVELVGARSARTGSATTHGPRSARRDVKMTFPRSTTRRAEATGARRYWARRRGEFLTGLLGGRVNKTVVVDAALRTLIAEAASEREPPRRPTLLDLAAHDEHGYQNRKPDARRACQREQRDHCPGHCGGERRARRRSAPQRASRPFLRHSPSHDRQPHEGALASAGAPSSRVRRQRRRPNRRCSTSRPRPSLVPHLPR